MSHECQELKNIKYQTMLLTGNDKIKEETQDIKNDKINDFLDEETKLNNKDIWTKLNKTNKIRLLYEYAELYGNENELNHLQVKSLKQYLKNCLERKQLQNLKDVLYNKEEQKITSIPNLNINKDKKFTLKRSERRPSTLKSLVPAKAMKKKKKSDE